LFFLIVYQVEKFDNLFFRRNPGVDLGRS